MACIATSEGTERPEPPISYNWCILSNSHVTSACSGTVYMGKCRSSCFKMGVQTLMHIPACAHTLCCYKQKRRYNCLCSVWLPSKNDAESHFSKLSSAELPKVLELTFREPYVWFGHTLLFCCVLWEGCTGGHRKSCIPICRMTFFEREKHVWPEFVSTVLGNDAKRTYTVRWEAYELRQALRGHGGITD